MLAQLYHCQNQAATLFEICKMHFRCHLWGICDLEHCYCIAALNVYFQRKMGWPQSPLTVTVSAEIEFLLQRFTSGMHQ